MKKMCCAETVTALVAPMLVPMRPTANMCIPTTRTTYRPAAHARAHTHRSTDMCGSMDSEFEPSEHISTNIKEVVNFIKE